MVKLQCSRSNGFRPRLPAAAVRRPPGVPSWCSLSSVIGQRRRGERCSLAGHDAGHLRALQRGARRPYRREPRLTPRVAVLVGPLIGARPAFCLFVGGGLRPPAARSGSQQLAPAPPQWRWRWPVPRGAARCVAHDAGPYADSKHNRRSRHRCTVPASAGEGGRQASR
jgi:hypothetical protein